MYYEVMTTEKCESDIFKDSDLAAEGASWLNH